MANEIANPLIQLSANIYDRAKPSVSTFPSSQKMQYAAEQVLDTDTVKLWTRQHLVGQANSALRGYAEQYRPEEREARNVPITTEIPGFIQDFRPTIEEKFCSHLPERIEAGYRNNKCTELADRLYAMAASVESFRGSGTYEFITYMELAERFDPSIKFRLANQLAEQAREKNPAMAPEEESAMKRKIVGVIEGITSGRLKVHEGPEEDELDLGQFTRLVANDDDDGRTAQRN